MELNGTKVIEKVKFGNDFPDRKDEKTIEQILTESVLYVQENLTNKKLVVTHEISRDPKEYSGFMEKKKFNIIELKLTVKSPLNG